MPHVTVPDEPTRVQFVVTTADDGPFAFAFSYFDVNDVEVYDGTSLVDPNDYTLTPVVSATGGYEGGSITLDTPVSNTTITVLRNVPIARETDFPTSGRFPIDTLNSWLDKTYAILQQLATKLTRTIRTSDTDTTTTLTLPVAASRASKVLAFDASGNVTVSTEDLSDIEGAIATTAASEAAAAASALAAAGSATTASTQAGNAAASAAAAQAAVPYGKQTIWVPAGSITPRTTNGCAALASVETTTNKVMLSTLDFDASTIEYGQFNVRMPKSWNEGTVTATFTWKHASTTTNFKVSWGLQAVALSDDDAGDTAYGTAQYANDTGGTTNDIYVSPETSAITIAGTPAAEDWVSFQVLRKADDGTNDTLAIDAGLLGVTLYYTTDAASDT